MHVIDENGASALCVSSARSMTPALSSGRTPDEGGAETCGIEVRTDENREARRVVEGVRVAVGAGDIPGATTMDLTLGKSSEQDTLADEPGDQAGNLGRAHGEVCGPVRHSASLPFSITLGERLGAKTPRVSRLSYTVHAVSGSTGAPDSLREPPLPAERHHCHGRVARAQPSQ